MINKPILRRKAPAEVAEEVRVYLTRINRRRKRLRSADENYLREVRTRVVEAVSAGVDLKDVAEASGYQLTTVSKWVAKHRVAVREVELETARERLNKILERRRRMAAAELRISSKARSVIRRAMGVGLPAEAFADLTDYELPTVRRWFASVRRSLEHTQRRREIASVRRGKSNRPPQHLSPVEYDQWLVLEELRRRNVLQKHGLRPRRRVRAPRPAQGNGSSPGSGGHRPLNRG
ncbi:hypothetical protein [Streptomyces sp. NPDC002044]|uniref:hypothetical protein n=1 Tax=Streptomyces sp. NPDC002044 TaxID=3154662 RepID=UPI00331A3F91